MFFCVPTGFGRVKLRRFTFSTDGACADNLGHDASSEPVDRIPYEMIADPDGGDFDRWPSGPTPGEYRGHPAWPATCARCGHEFDPVMPAERAEVLGAGRDNWQVAVDPLYLPERPELAGDEFGWRDAPAGAMRSIRWSRRGPDGIALQIRCPRGDGSPPGIGDDWNVDSRANNCTLPDDDVHYCWVREGDVHAYPPVVNVSKDGPTCAAGAGSILTPRWHGFLRNGRLVVT